MDAGLGRRMLVGCCDTEWGADINDAGVVVGTTQQSPSSARVVSSPSARRWKRSRSCPERMTEFNASAVAINNAGQIVGSSPSGDFTATDHAVLWSPAGVDPGPRHARRHEQRGDRHQRVWSGHRLEPDRRRCGDALFPLVAEHRNAGPQSLSVPQSRAWSRSTTPARSPAPTRRPAVSRTPSSTRRAPASATSARSAVRRARRRDLNNAGQVVGTQHHRGRRDARVPLDADRRHGGHHGVTGITDVGRLNDNLQTVSGYPSTERRHRISEHAVIPRLVQLSFTPDCCRRPARRRVHVELRGQEVHVRREQLDGRRRHRVVRVGPRSRPRQRPEARRRREDDVRAGRRARRRADGDRHEGSDGERDAHGDAVDVTLEVERSGG